MALAGAFACLRRSARHVAGGVALPCLWGLLLLLITVLLWTATALLLQELFLKTFPRPLFSTLVQSACPVLFLVAPVVSALKSTSAWKRGSGDQGLKAPIWQVALAGLLAKDAQVLTVDSCLRLLQQQRDLASGRFLCPRFIRALLRRLGGFRSDRGHSAKVSAPALTDIELQSPEEALSSTSSLTTTHEVGPSPNGDSSASLFPCSAHGSPPISGHSSPTDLSVVSRRGLAGEGSPGSGSSTSCTTGCSSCCSSRSSDGEVSPGGRLEMREFGSSEEKEPGVPDDSLAAKELKVRLVSVQRTLPLTALWLIAQLTFDASLPLLSITSNSVIQSTSVFLCYFMAVVFLKQPHRRSVLSWLLVLAGGVGLITSHIPAVPDAASVSAAAAEAFPVPGLPHQALPAIGVLNTETQELPLPHTVDPGNFSSLKQVASSTVGVTVDASASAALGEARGPLSSAEGTVPHGPPRMSGVAGVLQVRNSNPSGHVVPDAVATTKEWQHANDSLLGYFLCFVAAAAYAIHTTALKAQEMSDPDFDVGLVYGLMGMWVLMMLPLLTLLMHVVRLEIFMWPNLLSWAVLLLCGVVGTALADICWGRAVFLLNPVVAQAASNVQIPISLLFDAFILGRRFDGWYVAGTTAVLAAVVAVTCITTDKENHPQRRTYSSVPDAIICDASAV